MAGCQSTGLGVGPHGWFQEFWSRRQRLDDPLGARTPSRIATADAWWNSSNVPHATRWTLPLPEPDGIDAWLDATLADTLSTLASTADGDHYFFELALYHEDMHAEALLMTLQSLALPLPARYASMLRVATTQSTMPTGFLCRLFRSVARRPPGAAWGARSPRGRAPCTDGFRNFYRPERTDALAGFRTCAQQH